MYELCNFPQHEVTVRKLRPRHFSEASWRWADLLLPCGKQIIVCMVACGILLQHTPNLSTRCSFAQLSSLHSLCSQAALASATLDASQAVSEPAPPSPAASAPSEARARASPPLLLSSL